MQDEANNSDAAPALLGLDAYDTTAGAEEGAVMEVVGPAGEVLRWPDGRPWTVTYYGADSDRFVKLSHEQANRRAATMLRNFTPTLSEATENDMLALLVVVTKSWDIPLSNGSPAANVPKEYRAAYVKYKWLNDQANVFVRARANFLKTALNP